MVLGPASVASAQLDPDEDDLRLHSEPHSYTNVIDALDGDDPFDINVHLGFNREYSTGEIQREVNNPATATGRNSANYIPVGQHEHLRNTLNVGLEVGVFHDLELFMNLPIVLSDTRELSLPDSDADRALSRQIREERQPDGSTIPLFDVPFTSPARSGIPHVQVGIAWGIFNQFRDQALPNWLIMLSGQFAVGNTMRPCSNDPVTGTRIDYVNTTTGTTSPCNGGSDPGITDGVHWIRFETRSSYRLRYVEPYAGLEFMAGFPAQASDQFKPGGDLDGFTNARGPRAPLDVHAEHFARLVEHMRFEPHGVTQAHRQGHAGLHRDLDGHLRHRSGAPHGNQRDERHGRTSSRRYRHGENLAARGAC